MAYGTLGIADLLAVNSQSVAAFGEQTVFDAIDAYLVARNEQLNEMLANLADTTTDKQRRVGGVDSMGEFDELDEWGRADAEKVATYDTVGFPLRMYGKALQWNRKYFQNATPAEVAAQVTAMTTADTMTMQRLIKQAVFTPTNRTNIDKLVDKVTLAQVKALQNGDGAPIMPGPNGETFDGATHTHYLATVGASLAASDISALIATVREHYVTGQMMLYINAAQETAVRGFTSNFDRYTASGIHLPDTSQYAIGNLDVMNVGNRAIGVFDSTAEVWVKPWIPAGYMFCWIMGQDKPLVRRERNAGSSVLMLDYEDEQYPLRAKQFGREIGFGVWTRTNGAVLDTGHQTNYVAPTL